MGAALAGRTARQRGQRGGTGAALGAGQAGARERRNPEQKGGCYKRPHDSRRLYNNASIGVFHDSSPRSGLLMQKSIDIKEALQFGWTTLRNQFTFFLKVLAVLIVISILPAIAVNKVSAAAGPIL